MLVCSLLEADIYGDEFELFALELLGLHLVELMAAGYAQESVDVLTALAELLQQNLLEEIPDRSSIGRALAAISPVVWNLQQLCVSVLYLITLSMSFVAIFIVFLSNRYL